MVISDLYKRVPGTVEPSREQAQGAWAAVAALRHESEFPLILGAYGAAEWTLQVSDLRPLARSALTFDDVDRAGSAGDEAIVRPADRASIVEELQAVIGVLEGRCRGDDSFARGAYVWLAWWVGVRDLPEEFMPASEAFERLRAR